MSLIISLRSEILKTKRTAAFYFTLIGAAVIPFILLLNIASDGFPKEGNSTKDPINFLFDLSAEITSICIFPMFVILICTLLPQVEYKNTAWKQVLTSPQTKLNVFTSKFLNIHLLMLLYMVANHLFIWVVVIATHFIRPQVNILDYSFDPYQVLTDNAHVYVSVLALCALQFWIGLRSKNFIVPIAIGIAGWFAGTLMVFEYKSVASLYFPYSFHAIRMSPNFNPRLSQVEWTSFGYSILFLVLGFLDFKRRKMSR
jgi:lantibiotic transport system permease protein